MNDMDAIKARADEKAEAREHILKTIPEEFRTDCHYGILDRATLLDRITALEESMTRNADALEDIMRDCSELTVAGRRARKDPLLRPIHTAATTGNDTSGTPRSGDTATAIAEAQTRNAKKCERHDTLSEVRIRLQNKRDDLYREREISDSGEQRLYIKGEIAMAIDSMAILDDMIYGATGTTNA